MRSEKTTDLVKDAVGMVQDQVVGQTKNDKAGGSKPKHRDGGRAEASTRHEGSGPQ